MKKEWIIESTDSNEKSLIKRLLVSRGIKTSEEMKEFLNPLEMMLKIFLNIQNLFKICLTKELINLHKQILRI